jgi:hypothetical protein
MLVRKPNVVLLALALISAVACSSSSDDDGTAGAASGSACEQACQRLESCSPGTVCSINGACTGGNRELADCINAASCDDTAQCLLGGAGGTPGVGGTPNVGGAGNLPGSGGEPSTGGQAGSGGASGVCANIAGTWSVAGGCGVDDCVITQSGCAVNFLCDDGAASYTGSIAGDDVTFAGVTGTCSAKLSGNSLVGSCTAVGGVTSCDFSAIKQ